MKENLYLLVFSIIITLAFVTLYIGKLVFKKKIFYKLQRIFLLLIIFHCVFAFLFKKESHSFIAIGAPFSLFYAPLFYSNILILIKGSRFKINKIFPHFILGFIFLVFFMIFIFFDQKFKNYSTYYLISLYVVTCIQLVFYGIVTYLNFNEVAKDQKIISFMNESIIIMIITIMLFVGFIFSDYSSISNFINSLLIYILMLLIVIIIFRFNILYLFKTFTFRESEEEGEDENFKTKNQIYNKEEKYYKNRLDEETIKSDVALLEKVFKEKIYLQSDLTLEILAKKIKVTSHHLSQVFTLGLNSNFNKMVNSYRVQHAISMLSDVENNDTIEEIGMASGFNSRTSFYRAFNLDYNTTPSEYRKKIKF